MIVELHAERSCTNYLHDLLDLIEQDMLIVLCQEKSRITSRDLLDKIRNIHSRVEQDRSYCLQRLPKLRTLDYGRPVNADLEEVALQTAVELGKLDRLQTCNTTKNPPLVALTAEQLQKKV